MQMREVATHELLKELSDDADKGLWIVKVQKWQKDTHALLRETGATKAELSDFESVITFTPTGPAIDKEHADWKGMLAVRLRRLTELIRELEKRR